MLAAELTGNACDMMGLDWSRVTYPEALTVRQALAERYAPNTVNGQLAAFRQLMKEVWRLGHIDVETLHRVTDLQAVRGSRVPPGRQMDGDDLTKLFHAAATLASSDASRARDLAILAFFASTGCRRGELVACDLHDYDDVTGRVLLLGKGNKQRAAYVATEDGRAYLADWLNVRGREPGPLFTSIVKGGGLTTQRLDYWMVGELLRRWTKKADIAPATSHDFRRTFISDRLDDGVDLETVQRMAGHADPRMTASYSRRPERLQQDAAAKVKLPQRRGDGYNSEGH